MPFYFQCSPLLSWRLCCCFACVFALIALASLLSLCWQLCPCCAVMFVLLALAGDITVVMLVYSLLLCWHCHLYCGGIIALVALASLLAFCTGVNRPHCADVFTIVLLALSFKAHIALVSLPLFHWHFHHRCVVCTNIGTRKIVCISRRDSLHPFTAIRDLVFDRSLDCDAMSQVGWGYS